VRRISRRTRIPLPRILMPVGFAAILGGTMTLVGSSPLILLNDLMKPYGLAPFHLFTPMPVGLALVGPGRYHSRDFLRAGAGMSLVFVVGGRAAKKMRDSPHSIFSLGTAQ